MADAGEGKALSAKESELYDRQIRLWGVEAQKRMSASKVLFAGIRGVAAETAKNVVLAGINVTVQDGGEVTEEDLGANFFLSHADVGKNRAEATLPRLQELNKLADVGCCSTPLDQLDEAFIGQFGIVCMQGAPMVQQLRLNRICRAKGIAFYTVDSQGYSGYIFQDLGEKHTYRKEVGVTALSDPITVCYPSLQETQAAKWGSLRSRWGPAPKTFLLQQLLWRFESEHGRPLQPTDEDQALLCAVAAAAQKEQEVKDEDYVTQADLQHLLQVANAEVSAVCAVLGGILGQELLKYITRKGEPAVNVFLLAGQGLEGTAIRVPLPPRKK